MTEKPKLLCRFDDLPDPGSRGFVVGLPGGPLDLFLVRHRDQIHAYLNSCPHTGVTLEWLPDRFLDSEERFIQCGLHGALFRIDTGECLRGPCLGAHLTPLPLAVRDGQVYLLTGSA